MIGIGTRLLCISVIVCCVIHNADGSFWGAEWVKNTWNRHKDSIKKYTKPYSYALNSISKNLGIFHGAVHSVTHQTKQSLSKVQEKTAEGLQHAWDQLKERMGMKRENDEEDKPNPCSTGMCQNGATCKSTKVWSMFVYECVCVAGYTGDLCESVLVTNNICDSEPCFNGGKCEGDQDSYICNCPADFWGNNCEIEKPKHKGGHIEEPPKFQYSEYQTQYCYGEFIERWMNTTVDYCMKNCNADIRCQAFVYHKLDEYCILKGNCTLDGHGSSESYENMVTYIKTEKIKEAKDNAKFDVIADDIEEEIEECMNCTGKRVMAPCVATERKMCNRGPFIFGTDSSSPCFETQMTCPCAGYTLHDTACYKDVNHKLSVDIRENGSEKCGGCVSNQEHKQSPCYHNGDINKPYCCYGFQLNTSSAGEPMCIYLNAKAKYRH